MFHGFDYPDEKGNNKFGVRFGEALMKKGIIEFERPDSQTLKTREIRDNCYKKFIVGTNFSIEEFDEKPNCSQSEENCIKEGE
jgi:CRISPR-associated protein Cas5d